ncbi:MAG: hypothetical protein ACLUOS_16900 [Odoribacter splanchnicus]
MVAPYSGGRTSLIWNSGRQRLCEMGYDAGMETGHVNLTHFNASNPGKVTDPLIDNDQRITRGMTSFALENNYEKTSGALSFFYNWGKHWINDGYAVGGEPLDYRFNSRDDMLGLSWYQSVQLFKGNRLTAGVDLFRRGS